MASAAVMSTSAAMGVDEQSLTHKPKQPRSPKPARPNYNYIHRNLLPVEVYPLPTLIPHNPVSLVAIALSYLTRLIAPPQRSTFTGYFSAATSSIHVTDHDTIRALWEMGFFGRGSLSRSEPTWHETQKRKGLTAEENTGQRRMERRQQKLERAKKEQEDIAQQLAKENKLLGEVKVAPPTSQPKHISLEALNGNILKTNEADINGIESVLGSTPDKSTDIHGFDEWKKTVGSTGIPTPPPTTASDGDLERPVKRLQRSKTVRFSPTTEAREFDLSSPVITPIKEPGSAPMLEALPSSTTTITSAPALIPTSVSTPRSEIENKEHLNLSLEEAFFLSYGLGVLNVSCEESDTILPPSSLLSLFRRHSYHPTRSISMAQQPDDPFMLSYAVYHHYRSLGWVVRSGVKFSVDYLLYNRGPAFAHAEFAIVILPAYSHPHWSSTPEQKKYVTSKTKKSWDWLHGINRVQAQVHKALVLCYVEVPPPLTRSEKGPDVDIAKELARYTIRDVSVKRWTPNRTRD